MKFFSDDLSTKTYQKWSHAGFRFVPIPMTLNDFERRNIPYFAFFTEFDSFAGRLYHSG